GGECLGFGNPELAKLWINSLSRNPDPLRTSAAQREGLLDAEESRITRFIGGVLFSRKTRDARRWRPRDLCYSAMGFCPCRLAEHTPQLLGRTIILCNPRVRILSLREGITSQCGEA
ncbi:hypothetical protein U1Q18_022874, partial [Sarracenia purpurea var. burkii]